MVQPAESSGAPASGNELRVCVRCGITALNGQARCHICNEPMGVRGHMVQCLLPGRPWARLEMVLPCPHCGVEFSPRPEAVESAAQCPSCQQPTVVEAAWWDEAVHLAHAVVDLGQPDFHHQNEALGAFNPFADVGVSMPCASLPSDRIPMQSMLRLRVGPGAPPCLRCGTPLIVRVLTQGRQTTECPQCGDREAFALPLSLVGRVPAIRALIGFAPETAAAQGRIEPWWLLMEGPSTLRPLVQAQVEQSHKDAAERVAWEAWNLQERERLEREARLQAAQSERESAERGKQQKAARERVEREKADRLAQETAAALKDTQAQLEQSQRALQDTQSRAAQTQQSMEQALGAAQEAHRGDVERLQQDSWAQAEQLRGMLAQQEGMWRAQDARRQQAMTDVERKHTVRWRVAIGLWVLFFVAVAADLLLAVK
jgi:hypothetical protein